MIEGPSGRSKAMSLGIQSEINRWTHLIAGFGCCHRQYMVSHVSFANIRHHVGFGGSPVGGFQKPRGSVDSIGEGAIRDVPVSIGESGRSWNRSPRSFRGHFWRFHRYRREASVDMEVQWLTWETWSLNGDGQVALLDLLPETVPGGRGRSVKCVISLFRQCLTVMRREVPSSLNGLLISLGPSVVARIG